MLTTPYNTMGGQNYDPLTTQFMTQGQMGYLPQAQFLTSSEYGAYRTIPGMQVPAGQNQQLPSLMQTYLQANRGNVLGVTGNYWLNTYNPMRSQVTQVVEAQRRLSDTQHGFGAGAAGFGMQTMLPIVGGALGGPLGMLAGAGLGMVLPNMGDIMSGRRRQARELQSMSMPAITTGVDMSRGLGKGFTLEASGRLDRSIREMSVSDMVFNHDDYKQFLQAGVTSGLMDYSNSAKQYADVAKKLRGNVKLLMEVLENKDVNAIFKDMKRLQTMGASLDSMKSIGVTESMFARSAGLTHDEMVATYGQQGAMQFTQSGLTGYRGSLTAMGHAASITMAQRSGLITPGELSRANGISGLTQMMTEGTTSTIQFVKENILPGVINQSGKLDRNAIDDFMNGKTNYKDLLDRSVRSTQQGGLLGVERRASNAEKGLDELQEHLGTQKMDLFTAKLAVQFGTDILGPEAENASVRDKMYTGLTAFKWDTKAANAFADMYGDPKNMDNIKKQQEASKLKVVQARVSEYESSKSFTNKMAKAFKKVTHAGSSFLFDDWARKSELNADREESEKLGVFSSQDQGLKDALKLTNLEDVDNLGNVGDTSTYYDNDMSPNLRAFLTMISTAEGTAGKGDNGYNVVVGGSTFEGYEDHPRKKVYLPNLGVNSTGAGKFQILERYYDKYKDQLGLKDFSPASQRAIAVQMIKEQGALEDIEAGNIVGAIKKVNNIWASLPGAGYGQHEVDFATLEKAYNDAKLEDQESTALPNVVFKAQGETNANLRKDDESPFSRISNKLLNLVGKGTKPGMSRSDEKLRRQFLKNDMTDEMFTSAKETIEKLKISPAQMVEMTHGLSADEISEEGYLKRFMEALDLKDKDKASELLNTNNGALKSLISNIALREMTLEEQKNVRYSVSKSLDESSAARAKRYSASVSRGYEDAVQAVKELTGGKASTAEFLRNTAGSVTDKDGKEGAYGWFGLVAMMDQHKNGRKRHWDKRNESDDATERTEFVKLAGELGIDDKQAESIYEQKSSSMLGDIAKKQAGFNEETWDAVVVGAENMQTIKGGKDSSVNKQIADKVRSAQESLYNAIVSGLSANLQTRIEEIMGQAGVSENTTLEEFIEAPDKLRASLKDLKKGSEGENLVQSILGFHEAEGDQGFDEIFQRLVKGNLLDPNVEVKATEASSSVLNEEDKKAIQDITDFSKQLLKLQEAQTSATTGSTEASNRVADAATSSAEAANRVAEAADATANVANKIADGTSTLATAANRIADVTSALIKNYETRPTKIPVLRNGEGKPA